MDPSSLISFSELSGASQSDLLPINTRIFPSTVQYGRGFWISLWLSLALFFICLFVAAGEDKPMQTYIVAGAFSLLVVKAIIFALVVRHLNITYRHKVAMSEWQDGVIVFPSGDVVVRLPGLRPVDTTIEAVCLTYAVVKPGCSIARCRPQSMLQIHFKGLDAAESVVSVCQADLRESALTIAAYINDVKSKSNTSF